MKLQKASQLFGCTSLNAWETELQYSGGCQRTDCSGDFLNAENDDEMQESLFDLAQKLPLHPQKAVHLAHSGIIGKGAKRLTNKKIKVSISHRFIFSKSSTVSRWDNSLGEGDLNCIEARRNIDPASNRSQDAATYLVRLNFDSKIPYEPDQRVLIKRSCSCDR